MCVFFISLLFIYLFHWHASYYVFVTLASTFDAETTEISMTWLVGICEHAKA